MRQNTGCRTKYEQPTYVDSDVIARSVERHNLEAKRLLSNGLDQHEVAALKQFIQLENDIKQSYTIGPYDGKLIQARIAKEGRSGQTTPRSPALKGPLVQRLFAR